MLIDKILISLIRNAYSNAKKEIAADSIRCYFFDVESTLADLSHACLYETAFKQLVVNVCVCADSIQLLLQDGG
ncbi:hypothetical protein T05_7121 [Trichinella murrelli]|uniref:Uncharacterized protein n=1 Tax=Trichinella murrelli TaxID=144512 RepID=A0A0V0U3M3_9BILA|nr:hypothetical protein T05_7121 [Trichinella murrelli]